MRTRQLLAVPLLALGLAGLAFAAGAGGPAAVGGPGPAASGQPDDPAAPTTRRPPDGETIGAPLAAGASAFVPVPAYRAYDSRDDPAGIWVAGEDDVVEVVTDEFGAPRIPDTASAVAFNVTVTQTAGGGFVQIYGPGVPLFSTSTVNWVEAGVDIANSGSSQLIQSGAEPGFLGIALGGSPGAAAHVIIDVTGYYELLPAD